MWQKEGNNPRNLVNLFHCCCTSQIQDFYGDDGEHETIFAGDEDLPAMLGLNAWGFKGELTNHPSRVVLKNWEPPIPRCLGIPCLKPRNAAIEHPILGTHPFATFLYIFLAGSKRFFKQQYLRW